MEHSERNFTEHCGGNFVGYINEISKEQLELEKFAGYQKGDYIGITGIESMYEDVLRGQPGVQYLLRDVKQKKYRVLIKMAPKILLLSQVNHCNYILMPDCKK